MKLRSFSTEGIILSKKTYGEADRIIVIFSREQGRISLLAKGVRRPKSRKRGSLEVFSNIRCSVVQSKAFPILTEVETINTYQNIRKNLSKVAVAYSFMETILKTTREDEDNKIVYDTLLEYMNRLEEENNLKSLRMQFISDILVYLGFWPLGKQIADPEKVLESIIEGRMATTRVGKKILEK